MPQLYIKNPKRIDWKFLEIKRIYLYLKKVYQIQIHGRHYPDSGSYDVVMIANTIEMKYEGITPKRNIWYFNFLHTNPFRNVKL